MCGYFLSMKSMSLSPRPLKLTRIEPLFIVLAHLIAYANAWLDSIAGIMPSNLDNKKNASAASSSVMYSYLTLPISFKKACSGPTPG